MKKLVKNRKFTIKSKLTNLLRLERDINVTFVMPDKDSSKTKRALNQQFTHTRWGAVRKISEIIDDLHAIKHDMGAKYFII